MSDLHLDVDPTAKTVAAWIDGQSRGVHALPATGAPNGDAFATLISWGDSSAFDFVEIQRCAP